MVTKSITESPEEECEDEEVVARVSRPHAEFVDGPLEEEARDEREPGVDSHVDEEVGRRIARRGPGRDRGDDRDQRGRHRPQQGDRGDDDEERPRDDDLVGRNPDRPQVASDGGGEEDREERRVPVGIAGEEGADDDCGGEGKPFGCDHRF